MSGLVDKNAIKEELIRDRMDTLDQIGAAKGHPMTAKQRAQEQRKSEEMARRIVAGESGNRERYRGR